jgi:hypothetical protein
MVDTELLDKKIGDSGKKIGYLAEKCGLSLGGFYNCRTNKAEFKASHIQILADELNITSLKEKENIFFAPNGA